MPSRLIYPRPIERYPAVLRVPVAGRCPACGAEAMARYPIANFIGPKVVIRCQSCFHTVSVSKPEPQDRWPPFRALAYDWRPSPAEGGSLPGGVKSGGIALGSTMTRPRGKRTSVASARQARLPTKRK